MIAWVGTHDSGYADWTGWTSAGVFGVRTPLLIFSWMFGFVTFFNHTHPKVTWFSNEAEWSKSLLRF